MRPWTFALLAALTACACGSRLDARNQAAFQRAVERPALLRHDEWIRMSPAPSPEMMKP